MSSAAVVHEWRRRIEAEYRSAAITQNLALWLIQLGAPRELIDDALRIVSDELDHAELSAAVCAAAGEAQAPALRQHELGLPRTSAPLLLDATAACVRFFCLGETVAVPLFKELRAECTESIAKDALDRILRDEVRHRQFGWDLLDYFCDISADTPAFVGEILPKMLEQLKATYGNVPASATTIGSTERAWGLMPLALYKSILEETVLKEYIPRFAERGITIRDSRPT